MSDLRKCMECPDVAARAPGCRCNGYVCGNCCDCGAACGAPPTDKLAAAENALACEQANRIEQLERGIESLNRAWLATATGLRDDLWATEAGLQAENIRSLEFQAQISQLRSALAAACETIIELSLDVHCTLNDATCDQLATWKAMAGES